MAKKSNNNKQPQLYDEDGFFIDASLFDNNYSTRNNDKIQLNKDFANPEAPEETPVAETTDSKDIRKFRNKFINTEIYQNPYNQAYTNPVQPISQMSYQQQNQTAQYTQQPPLALDYENIVKNNYTNNMNYDYNYNSAVNEEEAYDDGYFDEVEYHKRKKKWMIILIVAICYIIFLSIGILNTNTINGYAQMIDSEIKAERVVYNDVYKKILELSANEQFAGEIELNELETTKRYTERKVIYSNLSTKYTQEINTYTKKRNNEKNIYNQTMYEDYLTLLRTQKDVLDLAVSYYTAMEGSVSTQSLDLDAMKSNLLMANKAYSVTFNTKIAAFEEKKINLKLK